MSTAKIALGVTAGYLLGRGKKLRMAIVIGGLLAGQRIATNPAGILRQVNELIDKNPDLAELKGRVSGELVDAARSAALTTATSRVDSLNQSLKSRRGPSVDEEADEVPADDVSEDEISEDEAPDEDDVQSEADEESSAGNGAKKTSSAKRAPAKKSSTAKKAPAKKAPAKKSAAKKSTAKKSTSGRSRSGSRS